MENGYRQLTEQDLSDLSTAKQVEYGAVGLTEDGRQFRYVSFGGTTTIASGLLVQAAVASANSSALAITATTVATTPGQTTATLSAGSRLLIVTNGSTAVTQDQFAEGFLEVLWSGGPQSYRILGNTAAAASTGYIVVYLAEPLRNTAALVPGTDTVNLWQSPYSNVVTTTTVNIPIGVTNNQVVNTASVTNYGWVQTKGEAMITGDGSSIVIGNNIGPSTTTAGDIGLAVGVTKPPIGWARQTSSTAGAGVSAVLSID